jgi:hypothetical protein
MWPPGGKSEEDVLTANAERLHAGDYAAACRRIAQLEIALQDVEDQHADLKHAYDLAQGTAEVLTAKNMDVATTEYFLQISSVRLKSEQIQLLSAVRCCVCVGIALQGA